MSKVKYKQCRLEKKRQDGLTIQVAWIESKFAVVGKTVKIRQEDNSWDDGWLVKFASDEEIDEAIDIHKAIRGHRKNTGDSLTR